MRQSVNRGSPYGTDRWQKMIAKRLASSRRSVPAAGPRRDRKRGLTPRRARWKHANHGGVAVPVPFFYGPFSATDWCRESLLIHRAAS